MRLEPHASSFPVLCSLVQSTLWAGGLSGCWPGSEPLITAPPVWKWLSRQDPDLEGPWDTPALPTHRLTLGCPTGIYGSHPQQWGPTWKSAVQVWDRGSLSWRQEARRMEGGPWDVGLSESRRRSPVKAGGWRLGTAPIKLSKVLWSYSLELFSPPYTSWCVSLPSLFERGYLCTQEHILCSNHSDWVVIVINGSSTKGWIHTKDSDLELSPLEKRFKCRTSYITLSFSFLSLERKKNNS